MTTMTEGELAKLASEIEFEAFPDHLPQREVRICHIMGGRMTVSARIQEWNGTQVAADMRLSVEFRSQEPGKKGLPMAIVHDAFLHRRGKPGIGAVVTEGAIKLARKELRVAVSRMEKGLCQPGWEADARRSGDKVERKVVDEVKTERVAAKPVTAAPKKALGDLSRAIEEEVRDLREASNG